MCSVREWLPKKERERSDVAEYFVSHFVDKDFGNAYIITQAAYAVSIVLLFNDVTLTAKGILKKAGEAFLGIIALILCNSVIYMLIGSTWMDWVPLLVFIAGYAALRSRYRITTRIVFASVFYTFTFLNLAISEPWEDILAAHGYESFRYLGSSSIIIVLLFFFLTWYLKRFSIDKVSFIPRFGIVLIVVISAMAGVSQVAYNILVAGLEVTAPLRTYSAVISIIFWLLEVIGYYMFYVISKEYGDNLELLSLQRKTEIDREMYTTTKTIYEEMSAIRHEMKNHDTYMRALLEKGDYQKLGEFLISSQTDSREFYQYVNCGNVVVNTIVNYEASAASPRDHAENKDCGSPRASRPGIGALQPALQPFEQCHRSLQFQRNQQSGDHSGDEFQGGISVYPGAESGRRQYSSEGAPEAQEYEKE